MPKKSFDSFDGVLKEVIKIAIQDAFNKGFQACAVHGSDDTVKDKEWTAYSLRIGLDE